MASGNCPYCRKRDKTPKCESCKTCRGWMRRKYVETVKGILEVYEFQAMQARRLAGITKRSADGTVERIDKQTLVNDGVMYFKGLKPLKPSRVARTKARAAGIAAQAKLRDHRRRMSSSSRHHHAHA